ncbi:MAG TPA: CNNM domain-containing protein, partial [Acidimicrobiales bacterium]|nr:CNNM domain-containing protein [Acidimicrobiales bacterium]
MSLPVTAGLVVVLLVAVGALAALETVLAHTTRARVAMLVDEGAERARDLAELLARRQTNLSVVVVVRHAAQLAAALLVLAHADRTDPEPAVWVAVLAGTLLVLVSVESGAKALALARTDAVGHRVAHIGRLVTRLPLLA